MVNDNYQYDVFLSYRRANQWPMFVQRHFLPKFDHWLSSELGRHARIFHTEDEIEAGEPWPLALAYSLARSKVMVCLWTREYFYSEWCKAELSIMLARREATRGVSDPLPLILAAVLHDCEHLDPVVEDIQRLDMRQYSNPWMQEESRAAEEFSIRVQRFSIDVAHAVMRAPAYDPAWSDLSGRAFARLMQEGDDLPPVLSVPGFEDRPVTS